MDGEIIVLLITLSLCCSHLFIFTLGYKMGKDKEI